MHIPRHSRLRPAIKADLIPYASFQVDDLDAEYEQLKNLGVRFTSEPMRPEVQSCSL